MAATAIAAAAGAAGAPGALASAGGTGGTSTFGTLASCTGGIGGSPGVAAPPFTQQTLSATGAPSGTAIFKVAYYGKLGILGHADTLSTNVYGGTGGDNPLRAGGFSSLAVSGSPASGFGCGADGGGAKASTTGAAGVAGQPGVWIVEEFAQ